MPNFQTVQNITNIIIVADLNFWEVQNFYPPLKMLQFRWFVWNFTFGEILVHQFN